MEKKVLVESPVVFDEEGHTYHLGDDLLHGVTPIISWLFPDTYKDIPQSVLDAAADYGTSVHKKCELYDSLGVGADDEVVMGYRSLLESKGLKPMLSEYLVSDCKRIASCIDKVMENYDLADIKATSKIHIPNVTMQLSIYAWLFEMQNENVTAGELYAIWLPKPRYGLPALFHLYRVPGTICAQIVEMYFSGQDNTAARELLATVGFQFEDEPKKTAVVTDDAEAMMNELATVKKTLEQMKQREDELKAALMELMRQRDIETWGNDNVQLTLKRAYERESIDSKRLKQEFPQAYVDCRKVVKVSESLTYKLI